MECINLPGLRLSLQPRVALAYTRLFGIILPLRIQWIVNFPLSVLRQSTHGTENANSQRIARQAARSVIKKIKE